MAEAEAREERPLTFISFISDAHDVSHLPDWVKPPKQITDGRWGQLASAPGAILATPDENIAGS
jgi:hypothetical protein